MSKMENDKEMNQSIMKGESYKAQVAALLYLRSKNSNRISCFQVENNIARAGSLDAIVYRSLSTDDLTWHTTLIQLQHKERSVLGVGSFTEPNGDFSLMKYLNFYNEIKKATLEDEYKNRLFFVGSLDCFGFIIYTNSKVGTILMERKDIPEKGEVISSTNGDLEELLMTNVDKELVFQFTREHDQEVFSFLEEAEYTSEDVNDFLEKLTVFSGQPTESDLDDVIKKELVIACGGAVSDAEEIYRVFEELFKQTWMNTYVILDEKSDMLHKAIDQISSQAELIKQVELYTFELSFNDSCWKCFTPSFFEGTSLLHVATRNGKCIRLCATQVLQLLQAKKLAFTFTSLAHLMKHHSTLIPDWKDGSKDMLVIVNDCLKENGKDSFTSLSNTITEVLKENSQKVAIVVSSQSCSLVIHLKGSISKDTCKVLDFTFDLNDFDQASQEKILGKEVYFQDHKMALQSLYEGNLNFLKSLINDDLVESLISEPKISIGEKLPCSIQHFIPRKLKRHACLNVEIFKSEMLTDIFAVSGVNVHELQQLVNTTEIVKTVSDHLNSVNSSSSHDGSKSRFLVLDAGKANEEYNELCQNESRVHWIHVEDKLFWWVKSNGSISNIKQFTDSSRKTIVKSETILETENKACLVIAEPGMGKSTLIPVLAQAAKNANPALWVMCINLRHHSELVNQSQQLNAFQFLTSAMQIDSPLEKAFLRVSLEQTGNIIIFVDSFDEICPMYKEEGCAILTSILNTAVRKLVVTSHHCIQDILEEHLSTLAYNLIEFSEEDQQIYFRQFWSQVSTPMASVQLDYIIRELIKSVNLIDPEKRILGIPLQTMMLAEVFKDFIMDPANNEFPEKLNLLNLLERFIDKKFMLQLKKGSVILNSEDSKKKLFENHKHAALTLLIPSKDMESIVAYESILANANAFLQNIEEAKDNTELIISVLNHKPNFIHPMVAEYFAGVWFSENYHLNRYFLSNYLYQPNYYIIRNMLDRILAKGHKLHEAIIDKDMLLVEKLLVEEGVDVDSLDRGGRSALHLAAAMGFLYSNANLSYYIHDNRFIGPRPQHMVELLLEKGASVNMTDSVLGWSPLEYTFETRSWDAMEFLLGYNAEISNLVFTQPFIQDGEILKLVFVNRFINLFSLFLDRGLPVGFQTCTKRFQDGTLEYESLLHTTSHLGHLHFVKLLLSRGADKRARDTHKNVPLHIAALFGHLPVVRALVESRSKVAISTVKNKIKSFRRYVNSVNESGQSALHAARNGEIVSALISYGANMWIRDYRNRLCLHTACCHGRLSSVQAVIESLGQNRSAIHEMINALDSKGKSPMNLASKYGHSAIVSFLVSQGGDVWTRDVNWGRTSLHWSINTNSTCVAEALLESVEKDKCELVKFMEATDIQDKSALILALIEGNTDVVRLLVSYGAKVSECDNEGKTSLHYARNSTMAKILIESLGEDKEEVVRYVNIQDRDGITAIHVASKAGYADVVLILISYWADIWARDRWGKTSLHYAGNSDVALAVIGGLREDEDEVRKLVNTLDNEGNSAMILASKQGRLTVAEILVQNGANVWARDERGRTCLHYTGNTGLAKALIDHLGKDTNEINKYVNALDSDGISAMVLASTQGYSDIVEHLVSHGADAWARNKMGRTSLHYAQCRNVAWALIQSLGESTEVVTRYVNTMDSEGIPPLILASENGRSEVVQLLISHGADVWARTNGGRTSLHYAINSNVAEALIEGLGKDKDEVVKYVNTQDSDGLSAIILASMKGYADVVRIIGLYGANVWTRDKRGMTSLHHASTTEVVHALIDILNESKDKVVKYVNAVDSECQTAMHIACLLDYPDVLRLLISNGGDVWAQDKTGRTCLRIVSESYRLSLAKIIIGSLGSDKKSIVEYINVKALDGISAWDIATGTSAPEALYTVDHVAFCSWLEQTIEGNKEFAPPTAATNKGGKTCGIQ